MEQEKKVILLAGPTASGKSKLAIKLAQYINGEIINADSMQIYKEFRILSSRPSFQDENKAKHHLFGFHSAKKPFSTGDWLMLVKKKINLCLKNKKIPILVGGTGLYFNAVINGLIKLPKINKNFRHEIRQLHEQLGQKNFYKKLIKIDPLAQQFVSLWDVQRSIKAYEIKAYTKKSLYEWFKLTKSDFTKFKIIKIFINTPRVILLQQILKRIDLMFEQGCVEEVKKFLSLKIDKNLSVNKLIGVKEIKNYILGTKSKEAVKELIKIRTRQYAKSQLTWSRGHMKNWSKIYFKTPSHLLKKIVKQVF